MEPDPAVSQRLFELARDAVPTQAARIKRVKAAVRNSLDGSTELYAEVVVDDNVRLMRRAERNAFIDAVERAVRAGLQNQHYDYDDGAPLVSFLTETESRAAGQQA
jgi:hypothetical protein